MARRWTPAHVQRLFWRAGFGASPAEADHWAGQGMRATVGWLLYPSGRELSGRRPLVDGRRMDPENEFGHDVLWWLDRMVRTNRPLAERMTLFWHDHFATNETDPPLMLAQNKTFRRHALGNFRELLRAVTQDPAMAGFLSLADSDKAKPNENFARELMELFTLARGYSERDIRQAARALTGFAGRYNRTGTRYLGLRYDPALHDHGVKRVFGQRGRFTWEHVLDLCLGHRQHAPYLVTKLWDHFVATPIDRGTRAQLVRAYRRSGYELRPVLEQILTHPALYRGLGRPDMVKAPVVLMAGALRGTGRNADTTALVGLLYDMGQAPFSPPSVAGWDWGPAWLNTSTVRARFELASLLTPVKGGSTPADVSAADAVAFAREATGRPATSPEADAALLAFAEAALALGDDAGDPALRADACQRVLRHLLLSGPDAQLC